VGVGVGPRVWGVGGGPGVWGWGGDPGGAGEGGTQGLGVLTELGVAWCALMVQDLVTAITAAVCHG
jgi:hypothetical protein